MKRVVAFSGSNSSTSINQQLIRTTAKLFKQSEVEILNLRDFIAPLFSADLLREEGVPASMQALYEKMKTADGFLISTPEHNGSMPAVLKNTIDWLSIVEGKFFGEKPTLFMSTSPGVRGAVTALNHLTAIMPFRGANITGTYSLGSFNDHLKDGELSDEKRAEIEPMIHELEEAL